MSDRPDRGAPDGAEPEAENRRLRRKLGLSDLEWALSGSFAEQRTQTRPAVVTEPAEEAAEPRPEGFSG